MSGSFTGERPGRGTSFSYDESRHLAAYYHVRDLARGKEVLDAGCGEGFGTRLIAETASFVLGIDYSDQAIAEAKSQFLQPNMEFRKLDMAELPSIGRSFDMVCNFQVLEHLKEPLGFVEAVAGRLRTGGVLILTTPNRLTSVSENPYHVREYTAAELGELLSQVFAEVEVYGMKGNEKVSRYDRKRAEQVRKVLRFDPFGLRHWLPAPLVHWAFGRLSVMVRHRLASGKRDPESVITPADFFADLNSAEGALDLIAKCRR